MFQPLTVRARTLLTNAPPLFPSRLDLRWSVAYVCGFDLFINHLSEIDTVCHMYIYMLCTRNVGFFWCKFITQHPFFPLSFATTTGATAAFIQAFVETTFPFHSLINHRDVTGYVIYIEKNVEKGAKRTRVYLQKEESSIIVVTIAYFLISACHDSLMNEAP